MWLRHLTVYRLLQDSTFVLVETSRGLLVEIYSEPHQSDICQVSLNCCWHLTFYHFHLDLMTLPWPDHCIQYYPHAALLLPVVRNQYLPRHYCSSAGWVPPTAHDRAPRIHYPVHRGLHVTS